MFFSDNDLLEKELNKSLFFTVNVYGEKAIQTNKQQMDTLHSVSKQTNNTFNLTALIDRYHQYLLAAYRKNYYWGVLFA